MFHAEVADHQLARFDDLRIAHLRFRQPFPPGKWRYGIPNACAAGRKPIRRNEDAECTSGRPGGSRSRTSVPSAAPGRRMAFTSESRKSVSENMETSILNSKKIASDTPNVQCAAISNSVKDPPRCRKLEPSAKLEPNRADKLQARHPVLSSSHTVRQCGTGFRPFNDRIQFDHVMNY